MPLLVHVSVKHFKQNKSKKKPWIIDTEMWNEITKWKWEQKNQRKKREREREREREQVHENTTICCWFVF